ncbi:uncharacterized protein Z519_00237 [Cladophialophora bantiana CBS 173.52]|uniref:Fungal N-terminal domain-containing protein n=1 Tax=Cladophialophora bantiana (strain ATCC 10958 / CBS 173.52 / CDC B-1940 / NIH 8579) TaxID=1442370 RepID=A0A0D2F925_CLAB1|nr:uncharacterized protein Z519_00237 [Cladophialophora bantiana CBS 173.52]KIW98576.1 hypothetical protein Z519_00237 [Cladophialophora bantiana CBS 173.52]
MADVVGLIRSIVDVANAGIKLSIALYTFSETVATAPDQIKNIARDVSLMASVLEELGADLKQDDQARLYSISAVESAKDVVAECEGVFKEIDAVVARAVESASNNGLKKEGGKLALSATDRLKWPFLQPGMEVLQGNLERLKSTLVLMLNVLTYARDLRAEKKTSSEDENGYPRTLLENLLRANEETTRKYQHLLKTIGPQDKTVVLEHTQSTNSGASAPEASSADSPFTGLSKSTVSNQDVAVSSPQHIFLPHPEFESSIRGCLKHIERALLQFEQSSSVASHSQRVGVHIELEKEFSDSRHAPGRPNPWAVLSIVRKEQRSWPEQNDTPFHVESNTSDDLDMYASVAAGALESINIEDEALTVVHRVQDQHRAQAQIIDPVTVAEMRERASRGAVTLGASESKTEPLDASAAGFRNKSTRKPWYSSVWESLPSPTAAIDSIQQTVKNSGLFFGVEEESENPDTVLEFNKPRVGDAGALRRFDSTGPKLARSPTFDDILKPPSPIKGRPAPSLPATSTTQVPGLEGAGRSGTTAPLPEAAVEVESTQQEATNLPSTEDAEKDTHPPATMGEGSAAVPVSTNRTESPPAEAGPDESFKDEVESSGEDRTGKEEEAAEGEPDAIDRLLNEWTTLYTE